jgi:hypothetical protein
MRVFACYVVSKLQRHRCPTFGALRFRINNAQTDSYVFIYIDYGPTENLLAMLRKILIYFGISQLFIFTRT